MIDPETGQLRKWAAIMGALALFARQIGRRQVALNTLRATALVIDVPGRSGLR